jgi:hypothetical protein
MRVALPLPSVTQLEYLAVSNQGYILYQPNVNDPLETIHEYLRTREIDPIAISLSIIFMLKAKSLDACVGSIQ